MREAGPPTPSALVGSIVLASLLMSLELTAVMSGAPAEADCAAEWGVYGGERAGICVYVFPQSREGGSLGRHASMLLLVQSDTSCHPASWRLL